ncbi:MAG: prophage regulatory protein [Colwellia sp.]|jgi:prophage regulatory protein
MSIDKQYTHLMNINDICEMLRIKRCTLWRWRKAGNFPKPIEIPGSGLMWRSSCIEKWISDLESKSQRY